MLGEIVLNTRARRPLVHCITNYVTANDCANILLACGGSAIMAEDPREVAEVTAVCDGLVLNMGTPNPRRLRALAKAGIAANRMGHPVVFDPVGAGSSSMRRKAARHLMHAVRFAAIRANASEIDALENGTGARRGVDADFASEKGTAAVVENALRLSQKTGAVVAVTGDSDILTDGEKVYRVFNGHPMMRKITGTGCQLSALMGAFIAANPDQTLTAALAAVCAMGLCGEIAHERLSPMDGNASYRNYIIDAVCHLTPDQIRKGAKYEILR